MNFKVIAILLFFQPCHSQVTAPQGATGPKGAMGATGPPGIKGSKGEPGPSGSNGIPGDEGNSGQVGLPGVSGTRGTNGATGAQGQTGPNGETGQKGAVGATGQKGMKGEPGTIGLMGPTGSAGSKGAKGEIGPAGDKGVQGDKGEKGSIGDPGIFGLTGDVGYPGFTGPKGLTVVKSDLDECSNNISKCDRGTTDCINTAGSYNCVCKAGYQHLNTSTLSCTDIDECQINNGGCSHICKNLFGSFICSCPSGMSLAVNNKCQDFNECDNSFACSGDDVYCINTYGNYSCAAVKIQAEGSTAASIIQPDNLMTDTVMIVLLVWLAILTIFIIAVLAYLIHVFKKMQREQLIREMAAAMNPAEFFEEEMEGPNSQLREQNVMDITIPKLPRSKKSTLKGKKAMKSGADNPKGSVKSGASNVDAKTASVRSSRAVSGDRASISRLSSVDTYY